ncbi:hypothetical protein QN277_025644 [Acacia crassicarpa]|nr:hypothetical protein QN277_025644 [Acacia crassicarpa]
MIGSDFSSVLYLPPKFGPTASTLIDKEAIIEDSSGKQWTVQISIVDKSYAFQEGWKAFSMEHGLEVGHFLVFHYMGRSHFVVKVFDRSGCEKTDFPNQRKQKKRKTITVDLDDSDELLNRQGFLSSESDTGKTQSQDEVVGVKDSAEINEEKTSENSNSNRRIRSLNEDKNYEDPCYLKDRDFGDREREDRDSLMFDAFRCEILNNSGVHRTGKFTSSNEIVVTSIYTNDPLLEDMMRNGATQDLFEVELTKRSHFLEELDMSTFSCERHSRENKIPEHLLIPCTMQHEEIKENSGNKELDKSTFSCERHSRENKIPKHLLIPCTMQHEEIKENSGNKELDKSTFSCERHSRENKIPEHLLIPCTMQHEEIKENSETQQLLISKEGYPLHAGNCENTREMFVGLHVSLDVPMCHATGKMERMIQKELLDMTPDVCIYNDQLQTLIGDQSSDLNSVKAVPSDCGAAHMLASISETDSKNKAAGGAPEETMADPLP